MADRTSPAGAAFKKLDTSRYELFKPDLAPCKAHIDLESSDTKPDNVVLNWDVDENGEIKVGDVVLGDLDCALKLIGDKLLNFRIGNVMWRSPEGQAGRGIGKHSEVFSFGLMVG